MNDLSAVLTPSGTGPEAHAAQGHAPSREQLLYWLHEAAEIEHHLMCCYLYAAFSLKRTDLRWSAEQHALVARWRQSILSVAYEEMTHLALVGNLAQALGSAAHFGRMPFPIDSGPYPAGFVIRLQPFSAETIEHFKFLERPAHAPVPDGQGFAPTTTYRRAPPKGRLSPGARDYDTVGELYAVLAEALATWVAADGEAAVFIGDPALQVDAALVPLSGVVAITDLASAQQALQTIVTQGEGAGDESHDSHFCRFARVSEELAAALQRDPGFEPAWPAATNPVMNAPIHNADARVHINEPRIASWLDIGNALYTTSLRCLAQGFASPERAAKGTWLAASFALMRALVPVGLGLSARPAHPEGGAPHAGLTFTPLRTLARLPDASGARFVAERLDQLRERAVALPLAPVAGESADEWLRMVELIERQASALWQMGGGRPASAASHAVADTGPIMATSAVTPAASSTASLGAAANLGADASQAAAPPAVEVARGQHLTVHFEGRRCIHSRHCVLDAPGVFKANTPGEWIFPDQASVETVVGVAHNCPSGAIRYERHDGGAAEAAPPVNQLRVRESGPYAVHAPIHLVEPNGSIRDDGFRATLCRCGQSQRKPWCDGSHASAAFAASGEPPTGSVDPLAVRDGPLRVAPQANGPLLVSGNLEICAGTGRTVARVTEARLCRCGQSRNKPFCDGSHGAAGFVADGV